MNQVVCTYCEKISALVGQLPCRCFWLRFWWLLWLWAWAWSWSWLWLLLLLLLLLLSSVAVAGARMWWAKGVLTAHLMVTWHDWTMARSWMIIRVLSIEKDISREKKTYYTYMQLGYIYIYHFSSHPVHCWTPPPSQWKLPRFPLRLHPRRICLAGSSCRNGRPPWWVFFKERSSQRIGVLIGRESHWPFKGRLVVLVRFLLCTKILDSLGPEAIFLGHDLIPPPWN